jgi:hypothetical protein
VGLFTLVGALVGVALLLWVKGTALRKGRPYSATLEFPLACGITVGTPVRAEAAAQRLGAAAAGRTFVLLDADTTLLCRRVSRLRCAGAHSWRRRRQRAQRAAKPGQG